MQRSIHLALYGAIEHGPEDNMSWDLYQSRPLTRLRDISLSSIPSRFMPHGTPASRFHHSVGVAYLARKLCESRPTLRPYRDLLIASSLCHDIGSPPFSHVSELFFHDFTGHTHEQQTSRLLRPGSELSQLLGRYGVEGREVVQIVTGAHKPLGPLIAGDIDLDNIDNSLHLLVSLGYNEELPYHPLKLIKAFRLRGETLSLDAGHLEEILSWAKTRRILYDLLHSEANLSSATMLYRALEFAYARHLLDQDFFTLGESDALYHLQHKCSKPTRILTSRLLRWRQYPLVYQETRADEDPRLVGIYADWRGRKALADRLAHELGLKPHELSIYVGRDRGEKNITLPFTGTGSKEASSLFSGRHGKQKFSVFAHKRCAKLHRVDKDGHIPYVEKVVQAAIADLPEDAPRGHVFF